VPVESNDPKQPAHRNRFAVFVPASVLALCGVWFWMNRNAAVPAQTQPDSGVRSILHLETFVLNLADADQRSYLRVGIDLGLRNEARRGEPLPIAPVRDAILAVLSQAKSEDLVTPAGKEHLKASLRQALERRVPELGVEEVYFTEFLIQR